MDAQFWHDRWHEGRLGFHEGRVNRMLEAHLGALGLAPGQRIFVPLCGKAVDLPWLLSRGYRVAGAELSEIAVRDLFAGMEVRPEVSETGALRRYAADGIDIFAGDIFDLTADMLGPVDAVYDRAALVALPEQMRRRYAVHLAAVTGRAPQLLVTFEYDQAAMDGPPFSVTEDEEAVTRRGSRSRCWRMPRCRAGSRGSWRRGKRRCCCGPSNPFRAGSEPCRGLECGW